MSKPFLSQVEVLDPTVWYAEGEETASERPARPRSIRGRRVMFIANWKPVSLPFMESLADTIHERASIDVAYTGAPSWEFTHGEPTAALQYETDTMARSSDLAVFGVAD